MGSLSLIVLVAWWMLTGIQIQFGNATKNMFNRIFGNKGATYVRIEFKGMSLLFVNCHFSAHQEKVSERRKDYLKLSAIISKRFPVGIPPPPQSPSATSDDAGIIDQFDCMFWLGDLNYRVNGTRRIVDALISRKDQDIMLGNDQLSLEMKKGHVLSGFHEAAPISFPPTFKFDVFKTKRLQAKRKQVDILENNEEGVKTPINVYDTSIKSRIPSWTDRILYASRKDGRVTCSKYDSEMGAMESDHKPVFALFDVAI
ncbi:Endonuclease/exonuclease/phosphatase [Obelidium mucronatum]|nr:Endonuclease/exonuclease/phosphatase [Obelidium mucronatum]